VEESLAMSVNEVNYVSQTEIYTTELLIASLNVAFEVETEKVKRYKSSGIDQIPAEAIQT
jgi:hypothetical protein